ncbi:MAG: LacI family DNA-binding transcriptional regulator [Anaerolineales bacterium]|nr:LacI family DNA-binding transcriptional regulator [Anaerolineales bacterium]
MSKHNVRISDVAKKAGVSPATVSVVVNNRIGENIRVSPETVERVKQAVVELGYMPNPIAQRLAEGSNKIIGLFTYEPIFPIKQNNFYYPFLVGIEEEVERQGYDLLMFTSIGSSSKPRSIFQGSVSRLNITEGSILLGLTEDRSDLVELTRQGYPFVFVGRREVPGGKISYISADYKQATAQIVKHIALFGHQNIACIHTELHQEAQIDRYDGYLLGLEQADRVYNQSIDWTCDPAGIEIEDLSKLFDLRVTAFIVENSNLGEQLLSAASKLNKTYVKDFSLAVLGDSIEPRQSDIEWTMFRIPRREMGIHAIQMLIQLLNDDTPSLAPIQKVLPCKFEPGKTVGPVPGEGQ